MLEDPWGLSSQFVGFEYYRILFNDLGWDFTPETDGFDASDMLILVSVWKQIPVNFVFFLADHLILIVGVLFLLTPLWLLFASSTHSVDTLIREGLQWSSCSSAGLSRDWWNRKNNGVSAVSRIRNPDPGVVRDRSDLTPPSPSWTKTPVPTIVFSGESRFNLAVQSLHPPMRAFAISS